MTDWNNVRAPATKAQALQASILAILTQDTLTVRELSDRLEVAAPAIRRALAALSARNQVDETYIESPAGERGAHGLSVGWFAIREAT